MGKWFPIKFCHAVAIAAVTKPAAAAAAAADLDSDPKESIKRDARLGQQTPGEARR